VWRLVSALALLGACGAGRARGTAQQRPPFLAVISTTRRISRVGLDTPWELRIVRRAIGLPVAAVASGQLALRAGHVA